MDGVSREGNPGSHADISRFIVLGHSPATPVAGRGFLWVSALLLQGCAGDLSILSPAGPAAERVSELWWVMLAGSAVILTGTLGVALYALKPERRGRNLSERRVLIGWGLLFPISTLLALLVFALARGEQLLARPDPAVRTFEVEASQWSWQFRYPEGGRSVDTLHVPAGEIFHVVVTSRDVIHSFWVPRLGGKIDAIPGKRNRIALQAERPGIYRGTCAEYCGIEHAHMQFEVHAHAPERYDAALAAATGAGPSDVPVLQPRRAPAGEIIQAWIDYFRAWLDLR